MASTDNLSGAVRQPVNSSSTKQDIRARVENMIKTYFPNTLGQAYDIVNIFMALIQRESSFSSRRGTSYDITHANKVLKYSAVSSVYSTGTAAQKTNILNSIAAFGLTQVTGYYVYKGCGQNGKSYLEELRPDLVSNLMIPVGNDVSTILLGDATVDNQLLAGLIVLEGKYLHEAITLINQKKYSNRLTAAVSAYLGLGKTDGYTTPENYANSIIRGSAYQIANNGRGPDGNLLADSGGSASSNGSQGSNPVATAASGNRLTVAGC